MRLESYLLMESSSIYYGKVVNNLDTTVRVNIANYGWDGTGSYHVTIKPHSETTLFGLSKEGFRDFILNGGTPEVKKFNSGKGFLCVFNINRLHENKKESIVGIYIGRFQGLTIGHAKLIDIMARTHPHSYVVLVKGEKSSLDKSRNPLPFEIQKKMLEKVLPENIKLKISRSANIENLLPELDGKNFAVYAGPDRVAAYRLYANIAINQGYHIKVIDTEQMLPRDDNISGTKLRKALKDNDFEAFKKVAPHQIWSMFKELQGYIK